MFFDLQDRKARNSRSGDHDYEKNLKGGYSELPSGLNRSSEPGAMAGVSPRFFWSETRGSLV